MHHRYLSKKYLEILEENNQFQLTASAEVTADLANETSAVYLISPFGDPRKGKSSLMNFLCNEARSFKVQSGKVRPCTRGADLSNVTKTLFEFSGDDCLRDIGGNVRVLDPEGTGNENAQYDVTLFCPVLLVSTIVIFNWGGGLQVQSKKKILTMLFS